MIRFDQANPRGIVWLASYPKSGNTWIRVFLYNLSIIVRGVKRDGDEINQFWHLVPEERQFAEYFEQALGKPPAAASVPESYAVRPRVQSMIASSAKGLVMLKTHSVFGVVDGTPTINTKVSCGAIYLVRDPRDVALSLANHMGSSVDEAIDFMNSPKARELGHDNMAAELWSSWSRHVKGWTDGSDESLLVVRYEDLLSKPHETFARILAHIRHPAKPDQMALAIERSSFEELRGQEEKFGYALLPPTTKRFFATGRAGSWREKLTPAQLGSIISANDDMMRKYGYLT